MKKKVWFSFKVYSLSKTLEGEVVEEEREKDCQIEGHRSEREKEIKERDEEGRRVNEDQEHNGTAAKLTEEDDLCSCKVYYEEKATLEWEVMFTVVKNTKALQQVLISYCLFSMYYYISI